MANTNYKSNQLLAGVPIPGVGASGGQVKIQIADIAIPAAAATTDTFDAFYLPPHAKVIGLRFKTDDLDTTTNVTFNLGDLGGGVDAAGVAIAASATRYLAGYSGQAASATTTMAATGYFFKTGNQKVLVRLVLAAGPSTTAGTVSVGLEYTVEAPQ